jgi:autophagy-related protein 16
VQLISARDDISKLTLELTFLKEQHAQAMMKLEANPEAKELQAQLSDLYKSNSQNAQRILTLMDAQQAHLSRITQVEQENAVKSSLAESLTVKLSDCTELIKEKDQVIQILRDELSTHQLELVQREEQLGAANAKVSQLQVENKTLVDRWMDLKQQEAARMNEANEFVETALRSKASSSTSAKDRIMSIFRPTSSKDIEVEDKRKLQRSIVPTKVAKKWVYSMTRLRTTVILAVSQ